MNVQKNAPDIIENMISTILKKDGCAPFFNHEKYHFLLELLSYMGEASSKNMQGFFFFLRFILCPPPQIITCSGRPLRSYELFLWPKTQGRGGP